MISRARIARLVRATTAQVALLAQHLQIQLLEFSLQASASVRSDRMTMGLRIVQVLMITGVKR